ncbi:MAG: hypothetical protein IANPNBLG_04471 [Bryobacteraceae bacterium]|nr:hypothetical protein [Bryobacteraceae bacterium]MCC6343530.1 DUF3108 domain-containing protein [Bryobacterales bacterium]
MRRPGNHRWISLLACAVLLAPVRAQAPSHPSPEMYGQPKPVESFQLSVEWRLVRAGTATLTRTPQPGGSWQADLHLESTGLVSKLYRVNDDYRTFYDSGFCADTTYMKAEEGSRRRETSIIYHRDTRKLNYLERDLVKNSIALQKELDIPDCVHDIVAALNRLRSLKLPVGQLTHLPVTDGKRVVSARIEAQEKEKITTPAGTFDTVRYEANLFNDVLYKRKGRLLLWLSDDDRKVLVQVRVRLGFPVGTISLQLEKLGSG